MRPDTSNFRKALATCLMLASLVFAACGKSGGNVADTGTPPGAGPTGANVGAKNCEVGQIYSEKYGCLNRNDCPAGQGWVPGEFVCVPGTVVTQEIKFGVSYGNRFFGSLQVSNRSQFDLLLKYSGKCEPYNLWNVGTYKCSYWTSRGGFIEIRSFDGKIANMFVGAGTSNPSAFNPDTLYFNSSGAPASYTPYIGVSQQAKIVDYNNSLGMQIIGVDYTGRDVGLRAIVENGRMGDASIQIRLIYQNVEFAVATITRY